MNLVLSSVRWQASALKVSTVSAGAGIWCLSNTVKTTSSSTSLAKRSFTPSCQRPMSTMATRDKEPGVSHPLRVGHFQTLFFPTADSAIIDDAIHGEHTITEPVLLALLRSPSLRRLVGVCQHGVTGLLSLTPTITRFEHSVGAFLLVRRVGGSVEEQVAGLLHDVSHTVLSHVMDWALSKPGESFHEVHKARYLSTTELPDILTEHGFGDHKPFQEEFVAFLEAPKVEYKPQYLWE